MYAFYCYFYPHFAVEIEFLMYFLIHHFLLKIITAKSELFFIAISDFDEVSD